RCGDLAGAPSKGAAAAALLSTLRDLGFVVRSGERTPLGSALQAGLRALDKAAASTPALQWAVVAGAVLLGQGLLTAGRWSASYDDEHAPVDGADAQQQKHVRVLSRVAALVPQCRRNGAWRLLLSRDVLAFNSAVRLVQRAISHSIQTAGLILAVSAADTDGLAASLVELQSAAPLECATSDAAGLLVRALLAEYAARGAGCWARVVDQANGCVAAPAQAVRDAVALVDAVLAMAACSDIGVPEGVAADLRAARDWAQPAFGEALE
ncbi:hypothetical protein GGI15_001569, partial [Coemansia interrupta]